MIGIKLTYLDITSDILALHIIIKENTSNAHESLNVMLKDTIMSVLNKN